MFGIYAGTDAADVKELMQVIVDETAAAAVDISEAEIARAKAQIKVGLLMALESSGARARQIANQILTHGRVLPIEEMVDRIDHVTVESARAAGAALIAGARPAIAALGPSKGLEGAAAIVESLKRPAA
jgi:predicted Zn-dependent peptidase